MNEVFIKNNCYSIDEIKDKGLSNMTLIYNNFVGFQKNEYYYLFEKQTERLRNTFKYRFIAIDKKNKSCV